MVSDLLVAALDQMTNHTGIGPSLSSGTTLATTQADELIIAAFGFEADAMSTAFTHGSPYANTGPIAEGSGGNNPGGAVESGTGGGNDKSIHISLAAESRSVTVTGTQMATGTLSGNSPNAKYAAALVTYKKVLPYVLVNGIVRADPTPTGAGAVHFTVTFTEDVFGVTASDFKLATNGVSGTSIDGVIGSGSTYTVTVNTGAGNGDIGLHLVDDDSIIDIDVVPLGGTGLGNGNFTGEVYAVCKTPPSITCPGPVTVQCASAVPASDVNSVTASSSCGGLVTVN